MRRLRESRRNFWIEFAENAEDILGEGRGVVIFLLVWWLGRKAGIW